jgi:hypothetical protein
MTEETAETIELGTMIEITVIASVTLVLVLDRTQVLLPEPIERDIMIGIEMTTSVETEIVADLLKEEVDIPHPEDIDPHILSNSPY